jgi:putative oxidoreductase
MNQTPIPSQQGCATCLVSSSIACIGSVPRKLSRWLDRQGQDWAPIFLRLLLAYEFGEAGLEKLHGDNWFADLTFPFPFSLLPAEVNWTLATGLEIMGPAALILGFMTRFFSAALMVLTLAAMATVHWPAEWHTLAELWQGYAITDRGYGNYKLPLMYVFLLGSLVLSGSGRWSVDAWLTGRTAFIPYFSRINHTR